MMRDNRFLGLVAGSAFLLAATLVACGSDDEESPGGSGGSAAAGGSGGGAGQAGAAGSAGTGGGTGGTAATGGTGGTGGTAGAAGGDPDGGAGTGGSAGSGGGGVAGDHVLISEVALLTGDAEFIEIWNPTADAVDLSNYYLSDNAAYHTITGGPWNPSQTPGTDFVVQFPAGTTLQPDAVLVVGLTPAGYESAYGGCPDLFVEANGQSVSCGGGDVAAMTVPANGTVGDQAGSLLSNEREMVILFSWDGASATVQDVDYVTWGTEFTDSSRVDKTGVSGYANDTPAASQAGANASFQLEGGVPEGGPSASRSIERCDGQEPGEVLAGGNGITGHDETSEDLTSSFQMQEVPSPGQKNACL